MRILFLLFILCFSQLTIAATPNVTLSIPVVNHSRYPLSDINSFQFIGVSVDGNPKGGWPETLSFNMDGLNAPTNGYLVIVRPRNSSFTFGINFSSRNVYAAFCTFQLSPVSAEQDDVSLISTANNTPVICTYAIDAATQQPTITIQDNPAHAV